MQKKNVADTNHNSPITTFGNPPNYSFVIQGDVAEDVGREGIDESHQLQKSMTM